MVADSEQQGLFEALKRFFQSIYSSVKDITGIRINGEIDYLFRQMTGLVPIDMRGEGEINTNQQQGQVFNQPLIDGLDTNQRVNVVDLRNNPEELEAIKNKITNEDYLLKDFEDNIVGYKKINEIGVKEPTQIKSVDNQGTFDPNKENIFFQTGFHGSPHRFNKFSLDHIGSGEGAQAHGWGLYNGAQDGEAFVIFDDKAIRIQQTFYQTIKAQQTGAKAADEKPSKEQIAKDLDIIKRNGVEKYERPSV